MSLVPSNSYIEPTVGASLNTARRQYNNSLRSILTNFRSDAAPVAVNLTASGAPIGEQAGMLFRSTVTNALYISDPDTKKTSRVGGSFTRVGIGNRIENGIAALTANASTYEIGELVATVSSSPSLSGNARLYLCTANTGTINDFIDVGVPQGYSVGPQNNVTFTGQSVSAISFIATSNAGINTSSPTQTLDVAGSIGVNDYIIHNGDTNTFIGFPAADTFDIRTGGVVRLRATPTGNVGIGTSTPAETLDVIGNIRLSSSLTLGDYIIHDGDTNSYFGFPSNDTFDIFTNNSRRVRITSAGNVGVNTASPGATLEVTGNTHISSSVTTGGSITSSSSISGTSYAVNGVTVVTSSREITNALGFGLGYTGATPLLNDWNATTIQSGFYRASAVDTSNPSSSPTGTAENGTVEFHRLNANLGVMRFVLSGNNGTFQRPLVGGSWGAWKRIETQSVLVMREATSSGVARSLTANDSGGSGWAVLKLNTNGVNSIPGASTNTSTWTITLPAGTYRIDAHGYGGDSNSFLIRLRDITNSVDLALGGVIRNGGAERSNSIINDVFTLTGTADIQLHQTNSGRSSVANAFGVDNIWSRVLITAIT